MPPTSRWDRPGRNLRRGLAAIADLLLPPTCSFCGRGLPIPGQPPLLCTDCTANFLVQPGLVCPRCAAPVNAVQRGDTCPRCQDRNYAFESAFALGIYRDRLREAVIRMKQLGQEALTLAVGSLLSTRISDWLSHSPPQLLVPLPAHWLKRLIRGVNGPDLLAEALASGLDIPAATDLLVACRRTRKQGTLLTSERFTNVRGAFRVAVGYDIRDANILLVDDIMTTGATASEAARTLRRAGASRVRVALVARGIGRDQLAYVSQTPSQSSEQA